MASDPGGKMPHLNDLDTVPPPDGGDAYGNATVVRAAPSEILEAIRRERDRERPVDPRAEPEDPVAGSEGKFRAAKHGKAGSVDDTRAKLEPKPANAKTPAVDAKPAAKAPVEPSADDVDASWALAEPEAEKPAPAASSSDSTDVEIPQGTEPSASRLPAMDAAALRPARVPQDFDKLMSQRTDASLVGMSAQPAPTEEPIATTTSPAKRGKLVVSIVVGVLVLWLAVMAAVFAAHVGGR